MSRFIDALAEGPVVMDGGLGTLLESYGHDLSSSLWSARLLADEPDAIRRAHAEFFEAGARVAITSSYQVSFEALANEGFTARQVDAVLAQSVELARGARADAGLTDAEAWVAASIGPYGASLADGSEYAGNYGLSVGQLRQWHRPRIRALAAARPDLWAVETIPSLAEVEAVCAEIAGLGIAAWVSVSIAGATLRSGESLEEAFAIAAATPGVVAVGVNCCDPADVEAALETARAVTGLPGVVYPNSGEVWHADTRSWSGHASDALRDSAAWVAAGARLVGGCCRVGPAHITQARHALALRA